MNVFLCFLIAVLCALIAEGYVPSNHYLWWAAMAVWFFNATLAFVNFQRKQGRE